MTGLEQMEHNIARCRVVLSLAACVVVYIDVETPVLARWIPFVTGEFTMDPRVFLVMASHFTYSLLMYLGAGQRLFGERAGSVATWVDVVFAVVLTAMTAGVTGPGYPFFAFAVVSSGLRGGLEQAMRVTTVSLVLYMGLVLLSVRGSIADMYIMRPVTLAITGYLLGYLGQQRLELQEKMRQLEVAEQRHRIARDLHDGYVQALAGINLRLESSRRMLRADAAGEALAELTDLQENVKREFDDLRRYTRQLAGVDPTPMLDANHAATRLDLRADMTGSVELIDHVLGIAREGVRNIRRHARASSGRIDIYGDDVDVRIDIADDGVGFDDDVTPWSITSRVREIGGQIKIVAGARPGAHLLITLPRA